MALNTKSNFNMMIKMFLSVDNIIISQIPVIPNDRPRKSIKTRVGEFPVEDQKIDNFFIEHLIRREQVELNQVKVSTIIDSLGSLTKRRRKTRRISKNHLWTIKKCLWITAESSFNLKRKRSCVWRRTKKRVPKSVDRGWFEYFILSTLWLVIPSLLWIYLLSILSSCDSIQFCFCSLSFLIFSSTSSHSPQHLDT